MKNGFSTDDVFTLALGLSEIFSCCPGKRILKS